MKLSLVATPIGNLEDMTLRAIRTLSEADLIIAEDTRRIRQLLTHFKIEGKNVVAYHAHNEHFKTAWVLDQVESGVKVAMVTDAGMPSVADPGFFLVRAAYERKINPEIIPGVCAVTFAVAACGYPVNSFKFLAFPPVKSGRRHLFLERIKNENETVIFYESPHRIEKLISEMYDIFGPNRLIALIREATKCHEEVIRGTTAEVLELSKTRTLKGEFTIVVCGTQTQEDIDDSET